ncbi:hypothetical protein ACP70R_000997 [Stipagrostis hirtigluma subsp. patula]
MYSKQSNAIFSGLSFEDALLRQACFNVVARTGSGSGEREEACMSRIDMARGGAGSGPVPVLRAALRDAREEMAVRDCVELLGYSVDELGWSLDAMAETDGDDLAEAGAARRTTSTCG